MIICSGFDAAIYTACRPTKLRTHLLHKTVLLKTIVGFSHLRIINNLKAVAEITWSDFAIFSFRCGYATWAASYSSSIHPIPGITLKKTHLARPQATMWWHDVVLRSGGLMVISAGVGVENFWRDHHRRVTNQIGLYRLCVSKTVIISRRWVIRAKRFGDWRDGVLSGNMQCCAVCATPDTWRVWLKCW